MLRDLKKLNSAVLDKLRVKATQLDASSAEKLPLELLESVAGGNGDYEIEIGTCPRCGSTLWLAFEDEGMLYFCKSCHYYYIDSSFLYYDY